MVCDAPHVTGGRGQTAKLAGALRWAEPGLPVGVWRCDEGRESSHLTAYGKSPDVRRKASFLEMSRGETSGADTCRCSPSFSFPLKTGQVPQAKPLPLKKASWSPLPSDRRRFGVEQPGPATKVQRGRKPLCVHIPLATERRIPDPDARCLPCVNQCAQAKSLCQRHHL